ncbi:hypothetical protein QAO71_17150 (plasmid) [Halopseudomonas sp. SMJS2]|uniref:hypothetical protein n=1 Tax=Halopseudomonas sp. SMJS2 TaxID=3041098 RepID=UPI00245369D7|nr:hypothetical protein [Halopseudomonas sp. SMJS2]WGK63496.1 hypothetical protein QAO71_17150 [Halopseudomonas sp. SMJS2]
MLEIIVLSGQICLWVMALMSLAVVGALVVDPVLSFRQFIATLSSLTTDPYHYV